ncbi:MAG: hypothetical protein ACYTBJ_01795 [Planctomycetota bacterium]|jgi:hypothetical protein
MAEATPRPWREQAEHYGDGTAASIHLVDEHGNEVAVCHFCEGEYPDIEVVEANARLIRQAVNAHEALVEALQWIAATAAEPCSTSDLQEIASIALEDVAKG